MIYTSGTATSPLCLSCGTYLPNHTPQCSKLDEIVNGNRSRVEIICDLVEQRKITFDLISRCNRLETALHNVVKYHSLGETTYKDAVDVLNEKR